MDIKISQPHSEHISGWIAWKDQGIGTVRWSDTYREIQIPHIRKYLEKFHEVSTANLEACLREIPYTSHSKRKHYQSAVSSFSEYLHQKGILSAEERERIKRLYPKRDKYNRANKLSISSEDLQNILKAAEDHRNCYQKRLNVTLIRVLTLTGLRVSELCNLRRDEFITHPKPHIRVTKGKGGKDRIVPLTLDAVRIIQEYMEVRPQGKHEQLFLGFNPQHGYTPLNRHSVARRLKRISNLTGIPFTAHSFRRFCLTTWAKDRRFTLPLIQKLAGHSSVTVTEGYFNLVDDDLFEAFKLA